MKTTKPHRWKRSSGQSLVETALMLPLLIMIVLNVVNLGYFFLVVVNLTGTARTTTEYAIMGPSTPAASTWPAVGPANGTPAGNLTVTQVAQQDMTGALWNPAGASIQVCSPALGTTTSGSSVLANCQICSGTTCQAVNSGTTTPSADPEGSFVLNEVTVTYSFPTLIPGRIFNIPLQAFSGICTGSGNCTFTRRARMRAM